MNTFQIRKIISFTNNTLLGCVLLILTHCISIAQTPGPPSLAIGAGKVLYDKGTLDAELISSVIATKQDEVKNELATRLVLEKLANESYVVQSFAKKNIDLLFKERNTQIIKKELLRNASELMITAATLEFYLRVHRKNVGPDQFTNIIDDVLKSFVQQQSEQLKESTFPIFGNIISKHRIKSFYSENGSRYMNSGGNFNNQKNNAINQISMKRENETFNVKGKFLPKPNYIFDFGKYNYIIIKQKKLYLQNILLDLTYGVLTDNETIQQLGLFANVEKGLERDKIDNYLYVCNNIDTLSTSDLNVILLRKLKTFEKSLKGDLEFLTKYQFILSQLSSSQFQNDENGQIDAIYYRNSLQKILDEIHSQLLTQQVDQSICKDCDKAVFSDLLNLSSSDIALSDQHDDNWLYTVQTKILPGLLNLNVGNKTLQSPLIKNVEELKMALRARLISNLLKEHDKLYSKSLGSDILFSRNDLKGSLLKLISLTVNNFDHAETYEIIMNFITGLGKLSSDPVVKAISSTIIDAGEKYITVQKDSNKVSLDVESMAVDLYKQFSENSNRRLSMYFSVGINYNTPIGDAIKINDTTRVSSYSFLSEKIGLKYNFIDRARRYGYFDPSQKRKPIIKEVHALLFGSGLLYQIKELSTANNFSSPIVGLGVGITFLNDLDLNINYAFPIERNVRNSLLNISFDIRIAEYLTALSKTKKNKKLNN